mmetsp:Transcript_44228/g.102174  ORF Transcript_44228/g.102174 Transcript_44228/m.102174 type:complete len:200 (+) Transcript_44228:111-710(+)
MQPMRTTFIAVIVCLAVALADGRSLLGHALATTGVNSSSAPVPAEEEPFVVSFRVEVDDEQEGSSTASKLARTINMREASIQMPGSVARVQGAAFLPPSARALAQAEVASEPAAVASTLAEEASLHALSDRAASLAAENAMAMQKLHRRLRAAGMAEQQAFNFNTPPPLPTTVQPASLGYLVYEALVNTQAPLPTPTRT